MKFYFPEPDKEGFTVYCRSECINCVKVKELLKKQQIEAKYIDCDLYVEDNFCKIEFLGFMKKLCGFHNRMFPMIFKDGEFIGNYWELYELFNDFDSDDF